MSRIQYGGFFALEPFSNGMPIVDLTVNISQWKNVLFNNCITIDSLKLKDQRQN